MKNTFFNILLCLTATTAMAQKTSNASFLHADGQKADVHVPFRYTDEGVKTPIEWGLDLAWLDEANLRIGVQHAGKDIIDIVRLSFQPTASVEGGNLSTDQKKDLEKRISAVKKWCKQDVTYNLNCDHKSVDNWYKNQDISTEERAARWAKLIDMTLNYYKTKGITNFVSISPFNEPDFGWSAQGIKKERTCMDDFKEICRQLREEEAYKEKYGGVRMCGGNTLNDDRAYDYWNYLKDVLDEGNTHQLAGNFDNYASFFEKVRAYGHHATADELHNVMEAMVGVEYGMQTGIWWGTAEHTRAEFMKATAQARPGDRLAYAEHRNNWTSASVYRQADGRVQAFGGSSERQAYTTTYKFGSLDRPVWYDGQRGRDYTMYMQGGTGYQKGQTGFETVVRIQGDDDVMPHIDGVYKIVNVNSNKVLSAAGNTPSGWQNLKQQNNKASNPASQQWSVKPNYTTGDRAYHTIQLNNGQNGYYMDIKDWNYNAGAEVGSFKGGFGSLEQWYLEYAGNNAFYICSRYNGMCLQVTGNSKTDGAIIVMAEKDSSKASQKWRFVQTDIAPDTKAPSAPANLTATPNNASIDLTWEAPEDADLKSFTLLRSEDGQDYYTLCNGITGTTFTDNEADPTKTYHYKVYAEDNSLLRSQCSNVAECTATGARGLVLSLPLTADLTDQSENANHAALYGQAQYVNYKQHDGLLFSGSDNFIQLPYTIANHDEMTISTWVYYKGGTNKWQRIFDFGNGTDQYMFLTPTTGSQMRFAIKNGGEEQVLNTTQLVTTKWNHIVVTLGSHGATIYVNGVKKAQNENVNIKPSDIKPIFNYIGRSQFSGDADLNAYLHDFQIYNYEMSAEEVEQLATGIHDVKETEDGTFTSAAGNQTYDLLGRKIVSRKQQGIVIKNRRKILE